MISVNKQSIIHGRVAKTLHFRQTYTFICQCMYVYRLNVDTDRLKITASPGSQYQISNQWERVIFCRCRASSEPPSVLGHKQTIHSASRHPNNLTTHPLTQTTYPPTHSPKQPTHPSTHPDNLPTHPLTYPTAHLPTHIFTRIFTHTSTCIPTYLPAYLPTYLPTCLAACLPTYLPT